jgi:peptide/nickel transport system substrate-binding protein
MTPLLFPCGRRLGVLASAVLAGAFASVLLAGAASATVPRSLSTSTATQTEPLSTVVVGMEQDASCLNFLLNACDEFWPASIVGVALPGAYRQAPDFSYEPMLVDHVDVATAPVFSLTYHLKQQAVWSDGRPVGADDLIFTWQTMVNPSNDIASRSGYDRITNAVKLDAETVRFEFSSVVAGWQSLFSVVLPQHVLAGRDFNTVWQSEIADPATHTPIGAGPFLLTDWTKGQGMTLTRNPLWWGSRVPSLSQILFRAIPDLNSEIQALLSGWVDVIYPSPATALSSLQGQPGIAMQSSQSTYMEHLDFNVATGMPLLRESWFRQAIAYAIDRQAIATTLYGAIDPGIEPAQNLLYTSRQWQYEPSFADYKRDLSKVVDLMTSNGCTKDTDGIYVCGGIRASFKASTTAGTVRRETELMMMRAQLHDAGIELVPDFEPALDLFNTLLPTGAFDAATYGWVWPGDASGADQVYGCAGDSNFGGYCSNEVTSLLEQADSRPDPAQRAGLVNQAMAILADDVPSLPLYHPPTLLYYGASLHGLQDNASSQGPFWNSEDWSISTPGDGGGGGGGGGSSGGGGGAYPDVGVAITSEQATAPALGGQIVWHVTVSDHPNAGSAFSLFSDVTLPTGFTVTNTYSDRGKGCSAATPGLVCNLDWISPTAPGHITIWGTVGQDGPQTLSVHARHALQDGNPADDTASLTLQPAAAPFTPPVTPAPAKAVKPVISRASIAPRPTAGKRVTVTFHITRSDNGKPLTAGKLTCNPKINGKPIRHTEQLKRGTARLTLTIPKTAKGKLLTIKLTIKTASGTTTRTATFHIK